MPWWEIFKIWTYAFTDDPLSGTNNRDFEIGGTSQPEGIPDIRQGGAFGSGGGGSVRLRDTNDFVDLSTVTNRIHRYKEYERLRNMAEIEMAMTVFADEACFSGDTKVATPHGFRTLKDLAEKETERFLVYSYDFDKRDYTLAWAYNPRKTKTAKTVKVSLDNGQSFVCTPDHRILLHSGQWKAAGELTVQDHLMPFYRIPANQDLTGLKHNQFPRIFTHGKGWIHERQFVDEWTGCSISEELKSVNRYCQMIAHGLSVRQIKATTGNDFGTIQDRLARAGFSNRELKWLGKKSQFRKVVGVQPFEEMDVYDISVEKHANFATDWGIAHNCQQDDDGRVFEIDCKDQSIKEELEFLLFHRQMLNFDQKKTWNMAKQLFIYGDFFYEIVINIDNPKEGILGLVPLPADSMYRIETTRGKLIEFQQSKEGPDYQSLAKIEVTKATDADLQQATAVRFAPQQIIHIRIGDDRKTFYPYGVSLIEAARGPAHQLRMMEDAMVVYRLTRAPERRVFYIDTMGINPSRLESFMERLKDQFRKKKVPSRSGQPGAAGVEERWHTPAADEDFWIPIRGQSQTRVETLPGAQNLGEIDDTLYFRNKLFAALNFPKNYFNNEDTQSTRIALSAQDIKFARMIERLQSHIVDAFWDICDRHLKLLGYPESAYEDLTIKMTAPSDWRELTRAEVITNRINNAVALKQAGVMPDYDILTKWLKYDDDETKKMIARLKLQKLEELKMQIIAQNPALLGVGIPGPNEQEIGTELGGPNPMLGPTPPGGAPPGMPPPGMPPGSPPGAPPAMPGPAPGMPPNAMGMRKYMDDGEDDGMASMAALPSGPPPKPGSGSALPEPTAEDLRKYDLAIVDFEKDIDEEDVDASEIE